MAVIDTGSSTTGKANVDSNFNLQVNLPTTASQAGYAQQVYIPGSSLTKIEKINFDGAKYIGDQNNEMELNFNSASTSWHTKFGTNASTMTKAVSAGFMQLNNGNSVAINVGISIYTWQTFKVETGYDLRVRFEAKHGFGEVSNKQMELGLGYYAFAAGQAAAMNEFIGFRWGTTGNLLGIVETSSGGAPTTQTVNINGAVPFANNITKEYEIIISHQRVEFWTSGTFQGSIAIPNNTYNVIKAIAYPVIARVYNTGSAPSSAPTLSIGNISVTRIGCNDAESPPLRCATQNKSSYWYQPDLTSATTATHNFPGSGTPPTGATGSNTASVLNNNAQMGGFYRMNGATITATAHSNFIVAAYQNPGIPTAAGVANNYRNFYVTAIAVSPMVVSAALTGGGYVAVWFAAIGSSALSLATTDADGSTAVAQTAPRVVPLSRVTSFAAAAAIGTIETGAGEFITYFNTPLVIYPGQFIHLGIRTLQVTALVSAGTIDGTVMINGYWE